MATLKLKLKKIDPVKFALIYATVFALITFVLFAILLLFGSLFGAALGDTMGPLGAIMGGGIMMLIIVPIFYFVIGFIFTWIGAIALNFVLLKTGGLDIEFENTEGNISMIGKD